MARRRSGARIVLGALSLIGAAVAAVKPSLAQERPVIAELTCETARAMVAAQGAVVMSTGPAGYARLVRDAGECSNDETTSPAYEASADQRQCFVGYRCRAVEHGDSKSD